MSFDENVTVPVGDTPVTVTVQIVDDPIVTGLGEHETKTEELACPTVKSKVPEFPALLVSPE